MKLDENPAASSLARGQERRDLEAEAITRELGALLNEWREQGDYVRVKVMELLFIKGWMNREVAAFLKISEQQVANVQRAPAAAAAPSRPALHRLLIAGMLT